MLPGGFWGLRSAAALVEPARLRAHNCVEAYPLGGLIGPPGAGLNLIRVKGGEGIIWDDPHGAT